MDLEMVELYAQYTAGTICVLAPGEAIAAADAANQARRNLAGTAARQAARFTAAEQAIIAEANAILSPQNIAVLQGADSTESVFSVRVGQRVVTFEPGMLPDQQGFSFGSNVHSTSEFLLSRQAFRSDFNLKATVLHELFRLNSSPDRASGVGQGLATSESAAARAFANRAAKFVGSGQ